MDDYSDWVGREQTALDDLCPTTVKAVAATFDLDPEPLKAGTELPPLWHWFYFLPRASQANLGEDGHPRRESGSFLPPIPLPRRMFAGARLRWHRSLVIGRPVQRKAEIRDIAQKSGRSGALAFVTAVYRYYQAPDIDSAQDSPARTSSAYLCLEEAQDIVYREPGARMPPPFLSEATTVGS